MQITRVRFLGFQDLIFLQVCTAPHTELGGTDPPKEQHCPQKQNKDTKPRNYSHHLLALRLDCTENQTQLQLPKHNFCLMPEYLQWRHLPVLSHSLYQKDHEAFYCWSATMELNVWGAKTCWTKRMLSSRLRQLLQLLWKYWNTAGQYPAWICLQFCSVIPSMHSSKILQYESCAPIYKHLEICEFYFSFSS